MSLASTTDRMVGGFEKKDDLSLCQVRLNKVLGDFPIFKSYKITHCDVQLVNGTNYRMTLVDTNSNLVKKCNIVIYENLNNDVMALKYREKENDCFT